MNESLYSWYTRVRAHTHTHTYAHNQIMIQDQETVDGVIGCLEYSPNNQPHVRHREIVAKMSERGEIIPFSDPSLLPKIHQTYQ